MQKEARGMETYSVGEPAGILRKFREPAILRIYASMDPASICAVKMLTKILEKEMIKYEANIVATYETDVTQEYKVLINLWCRSYRRGIFFGGTRTENIDRVEDEAPATELCGDRLQIAPVLLYKLARNLNSIENSIMWPLVTVLDFNRHIYLKPFRRVCVPESGDECSEEDDGPRETGCCAVCDRFYEEVAREVKKLNQNTGMCGVFLKTGLDLPFANSNDLFSSVSNDLNFILERRLFRRIRRPVDHNERTREFFAQLGIAFRESDENFLNISDRTKKRLQGRIRKSSVFRRRAGYGFQITSLENYFLIYSLLADSPAHFAPSLWTDRDAGVEKAFSIYTDAMTELKDNYYRMKSCKDTRYLIMNGKIRHKNRAMYIKLVHMVFQLALKRQQINKKMMIIHEDTESYSIVFSEENHASSYLQGAEYWSLDTFQMGFGVHVDTLKLLYARLVRRKPDKGTNYQR